MTTKYTLQDSLAYVELTGSTAGLRTATRQTAQPYLQRRSAKPRLTPAGKVLAHRSRYYKAAQALAEKGYTIVDAAPGRAVFRNPAEDRVAFVDRKGRAIVEETGEVLAHFRNG